MNLIARLTTHYSLQGIAQGILLSVITLFMVEKGMTLWQIGFAFGCYGLTAVIMELPLGALADLKGRIRVFRLSQMVSVVGLLLGAFSQHFILIFAAMSLMGLARALESGSVSAWEIERLREQGEGDRLPKWLGRFQASNALGIAAGAFIGGYLPGWFSSFLPDMAPTTINLFMIAGLTSLHILLLPILFREGDNRAVSIEQPTLRGQIETAMTHGLKNPLIRSVLLIGALLGVVMSLIEAYWQPRLTDLVGGGHYELFGWMATGYFFAAALGPMAFSALSERLTASPQQQITVLLALCGPLLWGLASAEQVWMFAIFYCLFIAVLVCIHIPAQVLMNENTDDQIRSTMQSVASLTLQAGGAVSSFGLSILIQSLGIPVVWQALAVVLLLFAIIRSLRQWLSSRAHSTARA